MAAGSYVTIVAMYKHCQLLGKIYVIQTWSKNLIILDSGYSLGFKKQIALLLLIGKSRSACLD